MRNLVFVIWMLGWPLINNLEHLWNPRLAAYSGDVKIIDALILITIWVWIGKLLYEKKPPVPE
jgi:hypothetical protein